MRRAMDGVFLFVYLSACKTFIQNEFGVVIRRAEEVGSIVSVCSSQQQQQQQEQEHDDRDQASQNTSIICAIANQPTIPQPPSYHPFIRMRRPVSTLVLTGAPR